MLMADLDDIYWVETRRPVAPWVVRVRDRASAREAKRRILERSQKRTLDLLASYLHRPIELRLASWLAETPVTANQVSVVVVAIALGIAALLAVGNLVLGALLMPLVNVLDGVDGKLARVKGTASNLRQLEHALDLLYEHAWYVTFVWGAFVQLGQAWVLAVGLAALVATALRGTSI